MTSLAGWSGAVPGRERAGIQPAADHHMIEQSRVRSANYGLREHDAPQYGPVGLSDLNLAREQSRQLMQFAAPVMETLYDQIVNTESMVVLTDASGMILHSVGDDGFLHRAEKVALKPGVAWSEQSKGTNAIGTALFEQIPVVIHATEHFLNANHFLTCSATPIADPAGQMIGVLDVTGDYRGYGKHTLGLVRMSAQMIENALFRRTYAASLQVAFHSRPEFIGTLAEALIAFDPDGRVLSANKGACFQLGLSLSALRTHTTYSLFQRSYGDLIDQAQRPGAVMVPFQANTANGVRSYITVQHQLAPRSTTSAVERLGVSSHGAQSADGAVSAHRTGATAARRLPGPTLDTLDTGDAQMHAVLERLKRVAASEICILIEGPTGSGKERVAQALHASSPRRDKAFVAVNCAAIPEGLIESELFGYEEGAFTGARRKGAVGKIVQAHEGTLFLDEIGDMPLALQARLLRVLQERVVTPLGTNKLLPVNVKLVCATHRKLKSMISTGAFRDDLYYRLNGLLVRLPALADRSDLDALVHSVLAEVAPGRKLEIAPETWVALRSSRWHGNVRELSNVLLTATVLVGPDGMIMPEHLPEDFIEELSEYKAQACAASMRPQVPSPAASAAGSEHNQSLESLELRAVSRAMEEAAGNVSAAARILKVSRNTLYRKLRIMSQAQNGLQ